MHECRKIHATLADKGGTLTLPADVDVAREFKADAPATLPRADDVRPDEICIHLTAKTRIRPASLEHRHLHSLRRCSQYRCLQRERHAFASQRPACDASFQLHVAKLPL